MAVPKEPSGEKPVFTVQSFSSRLKALRDSKKKTRALTQVGSLQTSTSRWLRKSRAPHDVQAPHGLAPSSADPALGSKEDSPRCHSRMPIAALVLPLQGRAMPAVQPSTSVAAVSCGSPRPLQPPPPQPSPTTPTLTSTQSPVLTSPPLPLAPKSASPKSGSPKSCSPLGRLPVHHTAATFRSSFRKPMRLAPMCPRPPAATSSTEKQSASFSLKGASMSGASYFVERGSSWLREASPCFARSSHASRTSRVSPEPQRGPSVADGESDDPTALPPTPASQLRAWPPVARDLPTPQAAAPGGATGRRASRTAPLLLPTAALLPMAGSDTVPDATHP